MEPLALLLFFQRELCAALSRTKSLFWPGETGDPAAGVAW